jgi:membrane protease YdiL (CAAX protease family)
VVVTETVGEVPPANVDRRGAIREIVVFLGILAVVCGVFVMTALHLRRTVNSVAALYMFTPAIAAALTRAFVSRERFTGAGLCGAPPLVFFAFWGLGVGIAVLYYGLFTLSGAVRWDSSGAGFLSQIEAFVPGAGVQMLQQLPKGMTLTGMLALYTVGGFTLFNIPGILLGFGEEFGWRGLLFVRLHLFGPWMSFGLGGLLWFAWHLPLVLLVPEGAAPVSYATLRLVALAVGAVCTAAVFAWAYAATRSIFIPSLLHITINNVSRALSYWVELRDQVMADCMLAVAMLLVTGVVYAAGGFRRFTRADGMETL